MPVLTWLLLFWLRTDLVVVDVVSLLSARPLAVALVLCGTSSGISVHFFPDLSSYITTPLLDLDQLGGARSTAF